MFLRIKMYKAILVSTSLTNWMFKQLLLLGSIIGIGKRMKIYKNAKEKNEKSWYCVCSPKDSAKIVLSHKTLRIM